MDFENIPYDVDDIVKDTLAQVKNTRSNTMAFKKGNKKGNAKVQYAKVGRVFLWVPDRDVSYVNSGTVYIDVEKLRPLLEAAEQKDEESVALKCYIYDNADDPKSKSHYGGSLMADKALLWEEEADEDF